MPDIDIFDPQAFFEHLIRDLEQEVIARQARAAILQSNLRHFTATLKIMEELPTEQTRALQVETAQLSEARDGTARVLEALQFEIDQMHGKLNAAKAARQSIQSTPSPGEPELPAQPPTAGGDDVRRPSLGGEQGRSGGA